MFEIKEVNNKKTWEEFLTKKEIEFYPLFQSWNWGEVQKKLGFSVIRIGVFESKKLIGVAQIVDIRAKRGHFLHLRHGPVFSSYTKESFWYLIYYIRQLAREKNASWIRISPLVNSRLISDDFLKEKGFINAPIQNMDAEQCWILDITQTEQVLLGNMRKSHRYLIKKAEKMDIKIIQTIQEKQIIEFEKLYNHFSFKKHFAPHKGIREEFEVFSGDDQAILLFSQYEGKTIAGAIILFVGNMAIYHHAFSLDEYKNIPSSYLLQWHAIKEAKKRKLKMYNFWGIAPNNKQSHPWQGLTLFKTGFGGEKKEFIHAQDLILNLRYWKNYTIELIRKIIKGY